MLYPSTDEVLFISILPETVIILEKPKMIDNFYISKEILKFQVFGVKLYLLYKLLYSSKLFQSIHLPLIALLQRFRVLDFNVIAWILILTKTVIILKISKTIQNV